MTKACPVTTVRSSSGALMEILLVLLSPGLITSGLTSAYLIANIGVLTKQNDWQCVCHLQFRAFLPSLIMIQVREQNLLFSVLWLAIVK